MSRTPPAPQRRRDRRAQSRLERNDRPSRPARSTSRATARPTWQSPFVLATGAAALLAVVAIAFAARPAGDSNGVLIHPTTSYAEAPVAGDVVGSPTAPVVIELYSDFQCPACKLFVTSELGRLMTEFVNPGTVRIEARDVDVIGRGDPNESVELAVGAACAADQNRYWPFHDLVFWNQGRENAGDHDAEFIRRVAVAAELDMTAWDACFARTDNRAPVTSATNAATAAGLNSTPTLIVNGERVVGVPQYDQLAALIRQKAEAAGSPAPSAQ